MFSINLDSRALEISLNKAMRKSEVEIKRIINTYTNKTKRDAKVNAQKFVDTGYLMRQIASRKEDGGLTGIVQAHAEYAPHVEFGHMVYKGQLFPLKEGTRIVGWRRIKETRFIDGKYYMRDAYNKNIPGFVQDMTDEPLSSFGVK